MRIDAKSKIAGQPAPRVRKFLRRTMGSWGVELVRHFFSVDSTAAKGICDELVRLGYAVCSPERDGEWEATVQGRRLAEATAAPPLSRATAEKKLAALHARIVVVNREDRFAFRVRRAVVYGSYLTGQERMNDLDVAVTLEPREADAERHRRRSEKRIALACRAGRRFQNVVEQVAWPQIEVALFLKSGSRGLSLGLGDPPQGARFEVIFEEKLPTEQP